MRPLLLIVPVAVITLVTHGPADSGRPDPKPVAKNLAAKHARVGIRTPVDANGVFVQELAIETPEPAEVPLMVFDQRGSGSGSTYKTKRRPGQARASGRQVLVLDYLRGGKDDPFIRQTCLKWAVSWVKD